ncbi:13826_t:CDS:1, partial [Acaulospora colombiana]
TIPSLLSATLPVTTSVNVSAASMDPPNMLPVTLRGKDEGRSGEGLTRMGDSPPCLIAHQGFHGRAIQQTTPERRLQAAL